MTILDHHVSWFLISWMLVISAIAYLDRVNIAITGSPTEREFHLEHVQLGWVFSAFILGYPLFQVPAGRVADHFGQRKTLTFGTVWWAVFAALTAAVLARFHLALIALVAAEAQLLAWWTVQQQRCGGDHGQLFLLRIRGLHFLLLVRHYLSTVRGFNLKSSSYYAMLPFLVMASGSLIGGR